MESKDKQQIERLEWLVVVQNEEHPIFLLGRWSSQFVQPWRHSSRPTGGNI